MIYTLILFVYANMLASGDSVALTTVAFPNEKACIAAGEQAIKMANGTAKTMRFVCVKGA